MCDVISPIYTISKLGDEINSKGRKHIGWTLLSKFEDLDYADDLALLSQLETRMQSKTSKLQSYASKIGLKINVMKTEVSH